MNDLFEPGDVDWMPVSASLATVRRLSAAVCLGAVGLAVALSVWLLAGWPYAAAVVLAGFASYGWAWVAIGRNQRSWKYAEREDELLVTHGVLFRELVVVPYGRMQFVDVAAGPLERAFGLATIELHTATPSTDAKIPGLSPVEAARLRDRLSALGHAQAGGL